MALSKIKSDSVDTIASTKLTGTIADARFPATLPAASGANLTALNGSNVASGTVADARISALTSSKLTGNLPALNASSLTNLDARDLENTLPALDASSLTSIPAGNLTGTVADARISALTASKLTGALPAISGASLTNLPSSGNVYSGHYYTNPLNAAGSHSVTGVGFEPDAIYVLQIANRAQEGMSWGFATQSPSDNGCMTAYNVGSTNDDTQRYDSQQSHVFWLWKDSTNHVQATVTSWDTDGFTFTMTETGAFGTVAGGFMFIAFKM